MLARCYIPRQILGHDFAPAGNGYRILEEFSPLQRRMMRTPPSVCVTSRATRYSANGRVRHNQTHNTARTVARVHSRSRGSDDDSKTMHGIMRLGSRCRDNAASCSSSRRPLYSRCAERSVCVMLFASQRHCTPQQHHPESLLRQEDDAR